MAIRPWAPGPVVDDDWVPRRDADVIGDQARDEVGSAAGRERDDDPGGAVDRALRERGQRERAAGEQA
jgi:hypothetical protein